MGGGASVGSVVVTRASARPFRFRRYSSYACDMAHVAAGTRVPYAVEAAVIEVAGKAFWYKRPLLAALQHAGVPKPMLAAYADLPKYVLTREIWSELGGRGQAGARVQRQIVCELVGLQTFDDEVDVETARKAVRDLREVAEEHGVVAPRRAVVREEVLRQQATSRRAKHRRHVRSELDRQGRLNALHRRYCEMAAQTGQQQQRGLSLEPLLGDLIALEGLDYHAPYRKGTVTQTDGSFAFQGFDYLLEARWRKSSPDVAALNAFGSKVRLGLQSTRGLFVSIVGFREEAVVEFSRGHRNIILMSGAELALILEGRMTFTQAMRRKIDEAARTGRLFMDLTR